MATRFLFHLCPPDLRDNALYSLNELRFRHPDLYEREFQKWAGREAVLEFRIPHLGCRWADTVNLSAVDPRRLVGLRRTMGLPMSRLLGRRLARIPVRRLEGMDAVWHLSSSHWINSRPGDPHAPAVSPAADFSPFDPVRYREVTAVPAAHEQYLRSQLLTGEQALGFVFIPHVLVYGTIPLAGLDLESL